MSNKNRKWLFLHKKLKLYKDYIKVNYAKSGSRIWQTEKWISARASTEGLKNKDNEKI
jgi:hypothetical protein